MKKIFFLAIIPLLGIMIILSSCKKKSDDTTPTPTPTPPVDSIPALTLTSGNGYISHDTTVPPGSAILFGITAKSSGTNSNLKQLLITRTFDNKPNTVLDSVLSTSTFSYQHSNFSNSGSGPETWLLRITDQLDKTKEISLVITTAKK